MKGQRYDITNWTRTDIPAFYGQWLINRIHEGFVDVRNPYNPLQVTRYTINREIVDWHCFLYEKSLALYTITK